MTPSIGHPCPIDERRAATGWPVVACLVATLVVALAAAGAVAAPASGATGPASPSFAFALGYSLVNSNVDPPGANNWSCRPSARHPRPVVLTHGTIENRYDNWAALSPVLKANGYCVFAMDYGDGAGAPAGEPAAIKGTGDIRVSARELAAYVTRVLGTTGATKVDIVGHSQGGMMPRQYLKYEGGAAKVNALVGISPSNHGTTVNGLSGLLTTINRLGADRFVLGPAFAQQYAGSGFLANLNAGGDTVAGVKYTVIATRYDEVVTPYRSAFLTAGPGATVKNIVLQDGCPIDFSDHLNDSYSPRTASLVLNALDPTRGNGAVCVPRGPVL